MKYSYLFGPVFADTIILVERFESKNPGELNFRDFSFCRYKFFFLSLCVNLYLCLFIVIDRLLITYVLTK